MCTATRTCTVCEDGIDGHTDSETKKGEYKKDTEVTCQTAETGHYEVDFDGEWFGTAKTDDNSVTKGDPKPHSYTGGAKDNGDGTHSFKCVNGCGEYGGEEKCYDRDSDEKCDVCKAEIKGVPVTPTTPAQLTPIGKVVKAVIRTVAAVKTTAVVITVTKVVKSIFKLL